MASPNTLTMQYMVLFSHLTVQLPSDVLSQKHELAVCRPAPFFCMITHVTMYLNGLPSFVSWFKHCSTTLDVHWFTLLCWYAFPPIAPSTDSLIILLTSSTTNEVSSADWNSSIVPFKLDRCGKRISGEKSKWRISLRKQGLGNHRWQTSYPCASGRIVIPRWRPPVRRKLQPLKKKTQRNYSFLKVWRSSLYRADYLYSHKAPDEHKRALLKSRRLCATENVKFLRKWMCRCTCSKYRCFPWMKF